MKTLSIVAQWLVLAALAVFVGYTVWRPRPQPEYEPTTWRHWNGVTILSYAGVARVESAGYPSAKRLEEHLTALRDAGYRTVRPEDVAAFLDERAPLPAKALLLVFEGGRKEAMIRATPILERLGFSAVLAVPTSVLDQWGGFYLKRRDLRKIARLPQWQVGSMGHRAIEPAADTDAERPRRFLAHRGTADAPSESTDAFRERILNDYAESARRLEAAAGRQAALYLYPFAEAGQGPDSDPLAEALNRDGVTRHFRLALLGGATAFNGPGSDAWTLTRLRVPGEWPAERLLAELDAGAPRSQGVGTLGGAHDWVLEREGAFEVSGLRLDRGAAAWLRGTEAWSDVEIQATLTHPFEGAAALYARASGPRSWLRVYADSAEVRIQERVDGRLHTLHRVAATQPTETPRVLRLRLRNNRAWLWLDGEPVGANIPVSPATRRGRVGFGADRGEVRVTAFEAHPLPSRWLLANSIRLVPEERRSEVQAVFPTWFRSGETDTVLAETPRQDLLLAAVDGIRTVPVLANESALDAVAARAWAAAVDAAILAADVKALVPVLAIDGAADVLARELRERGYGVAHLLSPSQAREHGTAIASGTQDEVLLVNASGADAHAAAEWLLKHVPPRRVALRDAEDAPFATGTASAHPLDADPTF